MQKIFDFLFYKKKRFFLLLLLSSFILRISSLYYTFLDIDESQFAGFAHSLMDGGLPYLHSLDTKPPFIYLFYWICFFVFGKYNMGGVHFVSILWSFWVALILYKIAKENEDEQCGLWAALFFVLFSTCYAPKFIATSITSVMILPLSLSILYWMRGENQLHLKWDYWAGLVCGIAFLFKYQAGIQIVVFFCFLLPFFEFRNEGFKTSAIRYGIFLGGFFTPIVLTFSTLALLGVWPDFVTWSLKGSAHYIRAGNQTVDFLKNLTLRGSSFVASTFILWYLSINFILFKPIKLNPFRILLILWFLLTLIPVCTGGRFYGHYFIQLLPPLCLLAAIATSHLVTRKNIRIIGTLLLLPPLLFWILRIDQKSVYTVFPDDQLFEQKEVGEWLKQNTKKDDTLFVWGFATAIYFHAERKAASRFLWADLLTGKVPGSELSNQTGFDTATLARPEAWEAFWEDMKAHPPTYFIDTSPANFHDYKKYPISNNPQLNEFVQTNYRFLKDIRGCLVYKKSG